MHKLSVIRKISSGDVMCSMATIINSALLCICKLLRERIFKVLITIRNYK